MNLIKSRLRRIEVAARTGARCAGCGFAPASPGRIVYSDGPARVDPSEQCASCGRRLWFVIEVVQSSGGLFIEVVEDA
jgi:hypothetical protein